MHRPKVPTSKEALKDQKKDSIEVLKKTSQKLQGEVRTLEITKTNLKKHINDAVKDRNAKIDKKEEELNTEIQKTKNLVNESECVLTELNKDRLECAERAEETDRKLSRRECLVNKQTDEIKKQKEIIAEEKKVIKVHEEEVDKYREEVKLTEEKVQVAVDELLAKQIDFNKDNAGFVRQKKELKANEEKLDTLHHDVIKKEANVLRYVAAVDQKEAELIEKTKQIDEEKERLKKEEAELDEKKTDIVVLGKKNQQEADRLKALEKDILNRSAKLSAREKLFKTKITGGKK